MDKQHIIDEIHRTAQENGGVPVGAQKFETLTGIKRKEWYAKYWVTWGDAVEEAGYERNTFQQPLEEDQLILQFISLIRELEKFPIEGELRIKARQDKSFPAHSTIRSRLGTKHERIQKILAFCQKLEGFDDVIEICKPLAKGSKSKPKDTPTATPETMGFVYLMKSGEFYKIGHTNSPGRREYELISHRPEGIETVHTIKTDDPEGIEAYWHNRFKDKRKRGEWFDLSADEVNAFKRRTFM